MATAKPSNLAAIPSVDRVLREPAVDALSESYGRPATTGAVREVLADLRSAVKAGRDLKPKAREPDALASAVAAKLEAAAAPSLRRVFNLTGTALHTNLGRAPLPPEVIEAVAMAALRPTNLEFDIDRGRRGDRDSHLEARLCALTGAEAATAVNNNAAAVLLTLNSLALRKEVVVSRGELIEIGGSFRMPDIMSRAGCRLREVGTTNRTHLHDYADAVGEKTALIMKVHTSNYVVEGFTAEVPGRDLAELAHARHLPFVVDLGSGSLVDLTRWDLPHEPTPRETLAAGADLVTFSGDKLLGGPQAGIVAGRADLVARIKRNPMKRAMRLGKLSIAALEAVLRLYDDPDRLAEKLPTLRLMTRPATEIEAAAVRLLPVLAAWVGDRGSVTLQPVQSQIGSGAQPASSLPSTALVVHPSGGKRGLGGRLEKLAGDLRGLAIPVIGRIEKDALVLDLRCLDDEAAFASQLKPTVPATGEPPA